MKIGDSFKTREGTVVTIISITNNVSHPVIAVDAKCCLQKYTLEGCYISPKVQHQKDLIGKV